MAALTATYTATKAWRFGGPENKSILSTLGTLVVTVAGGTNVGEIPASLFGLNTFVGETIITKSTNDKVYTLYPDATNGQSLLCGSGASNAPGDLPTGTYTVYAKGLSA